MMASTRTAVPLEMGAKRTSILTSSTELVHDSRAPGSHTVIRPSSRPSPVAGSYTSISRPPTPGSQTMATARAGSK